MAFFDQPTWRPQPNTLESPSTGAAATIAAPTQANGGLINASIGTAQTADPTQRTVQSNETVQGQIAGLIDKNSPLLQQARNGAMQTANSRGLLNSSMAASAGETAALGAALPIAQADAGIYGQASRDNQAVSNQTSQFNAGQSNDMSKSNASLLTGVSQANADNTIKVQAQNADAQNQIIRQQNDAQNKVTLQQMDGATRANLMNIEANYKTLMQSSESAQQIYRAHLANISAITMNADMDPAAKQAAVNEQNKMLENGMAVAGAINGLNLQQVLTFPGGAPAVTSSTTGSIFNNAAPGIAQAAAAAPPAPPEAEAPSTAAQPSRYSIRRGLPSIYYGR